MNSFAKLGVAVIIFSVFIWVACNDAFRPIAQVIPGLGSDPQSQSRAYVLSNNGAGLGGMTTIDVPGDTKVADQMGGHSPVHLFVLPAGGRAYMVNKADDNITAVSPANFSVTPITIPLPAGAQPVFASGTEASNFYVAESGRAKIAQIAVTTNILVKEISVGNNPVSLAETPNAQKIYVVNQGDNSVSIIQTVDGTVLNTVTVGSTPVWTVASSDGHYVFVANQGSNNLTVFDTTNDLAPLTTIPLNGSPSFIAYDAGLKRVYTANTASNSVTIVRADQTPSDLAANPDGAVVATVDVTAAPCSGSSPRQVAILPDGSRAFVANSGTDNVCDISAMSNAITKSIALPAGAAPLSVAAAASGTKVYSANSGTHNISVIRTDVDAIVTSLQAPKTDPNCQDPAPPAAPVCTYMNPLFAVAH